jgi:hypothetical protein
VPCVCPPSTETGSSGAWRLLLRAATDRADGVSLRLFLDRVEYSGGSGVPLSRTAAALVAAAPQSCCRAAKALRARPSQRELVSLSEDFSYQLA